MTVATIVTILAALGVGGIITSVVTGWFSKRKVGAEATEIIQRAASSLVETQQKEIERSRTEMNDLITAHREETARIARAIVSEREEWREILRQHVAWDSAAIAALNEHGIGLGPVPPVMPSRHFVDKHGLPLN